MSTISDERNIIDKATAKLTALAEEQFDEGYAAGYEAGRAAALLEAMALIDNV